MTYFSDSELGALPRVSEEIGPQLWSGLVAAVNGHIIRGDFAERFPEPCEDGSNPTTTDRSAMGQAVLTEVGLLAEAVLVGEPGWQEPKSTTGWPLDPKWLPPIYAVLDLIEFCFTAIAIPQVRFPHPYFRHDDLSRFDASAGRAVWVNEVNQLFARSGTAFELTAAGRIIRIGISSITERVREVRFATGDEPLDELLNRSRAKYLSSDPGIRAESLEQLWDALERTKTLGPGDKKASVKALIAEVSTSPAMEVELDLELTRLTKIGNQFRIRHHEVDKVPVDLRDIDYLFHRCFAVIAHLLKLQPS
jgi:hypothetical protein